MASPSKSQVLICMVRTRPGKPGKSWNLKILNSRPGTTLKNTKQLVLEKFGNFT